MPATDPAVEPTVEVRYPDPPNMPADERMTPAEFRVVREYLGLTGDWLATHLGVSSRTVRHWEQGKYPIPDGVRLVVEGLEQYTADAVELELGMLELQQGPPEVVTYRSDEEYRAAHPDMRMPASWHRAVVARAAQEVPGLSIVYPPEQ